ncbi:hypothetical protein KAR91_59900 [Candidatus Pacearchaeota archaeon]|nr:hypothetical protein [Candidatus Pacearchaeota archaeon]
MSAVETLSNTAIGFMIALGTQITVFPWFELSVPIHDNILLTVIFTVVSVVRGYCVRRLFNKIKKRITPPQLLLSEIRERTD